MQNCPVCGTETKNLKFCSRSCSAKHTNSLYPKRKKSIPNTAMCLGCRKEFQYRQKQSQGLYCSNACQQSYLKTKRIAEWVSGTFDACKETGRLARSIRNHLIEESNHRCSQCGWDKVNPTTGKCPLEVDHIDGNAENCRPENLRVLCPNCHSLTPTWKALNSGNGSKKRLKYGKLV